MKKILIVGIVLLLVVLGCRAYYVTKENKAINVATEYLQTRYKQSMEYQTARFSWADPSLYHISFSPKDDSEIVFEVLVQSNLAVSGQADNYLLKRFEHQMSEFLSGKFKDGTVSVHVKEVGLYAFPTAESLTEDMDLSRLEANIEDYEIQIQAPLETLFALIQTVKQEGFQPKRIFVIQNESKKEIDTWRTVSKTELAKLLAK